MPELWQLYIHKDNKQGGLLCSSPATLALYFQYALYFEYVYSYLHACAMEHSKHRCERADLATMKRS